MFLFVADRPRQTDARRKVVFVRLVSAARHAVGANRHQRTRRRVVEVRAVGRIHRWRVVFVAQSSRERQIPTHAKTVVDKEVVALGAQVLRVVDARDAGDERKPEQQVSQSDAGVGERRKIQEAARLHIAKTVLLHDADVSAKLEQVISVHVGGRVENLKSVGDGVLWIVAFVSQGRKARDGDETQAEIARVRGKLRQADGAIDARALILLINSRGDAIEGEARVVNERWREDVRQANHRILAAAWNVVAKAGNGRERWTGKRFEESAIAKAVTEDQRSDAY